jgi:phosphoserine phosphatase RsbU/P
MKPLLLLLLAASSLSAQMEPYIDISGPWKFRSADDPRYSQSNFDDTQWDSVALPFAKRPPFGVSWLRRTVVLPPEAVAYPLVLTLGSFAHAYEVHVNGVKVASFGDFGPGMKRDPRGQSLPVPEGLFRPGSNSVAMRMFHSSDGGLTRALRLEVVDGPYVLTSAASAPPQVAAYSMDRRLRSLTMRFLSGPLFLLLATLVLLAWFGERQRRDLAYLGGLLLVDGLGRTFEYVDLARDSPTALGTLQVNAATLFVAYLTPQVLGLRPRWFAAAGWLQLGLALLSRALPGTALDGNNWIWTLVILALAAACLVQITRSLRLRKQLGLGLLPTVAVTLLVVIVSHRLGGNIPRIFTNTYYWGQFYWTTYDLYLLVITLTLAVLLLRQLAADRLEKQRLAGEMEAAATVQRLLVAGQAQSQTTGYDVEATYLPAQETSGDFFHVLAAGPGQTLVVVGDVSGKGLRAALLVSLLIGVIRDRRHEPPAALLARLNQALVGVAEGFTTCCVVLCESSGRARVASAGHPAPTLNGREVALPPGLPLGVVPDAEYDEVELRIGNEREDGTVFENGAILTLVSDGVIEAENAQRELFGFERTREGSGKPSRELAEAARAWGQTDDITVVQVRRNEACV